MAVNYHDKEAEHQQQFGGPETQPPSEGDSYTEAPDIPEQYLNDAPPVEAIQEEEIPEENEEREARQKSRKYESIKDRLSQAQREKFQTLNALNQLKEENQQLRAAVDLSSQSAVYQYEENVADRLEKARQFKRNALESGDIDAQVDADLQFNLATKAYDDLNNWKVQQNMLQQQAMASAQSQESVYNAVRENEVVKWASENASWFHPKSEDYDEWTANQVHAYCNEFDNNLYRNGYDQFIYSPEYFQVLNEHVNALRHSKANVNGRGELNMRPHRSAVSPVRSYSGQSEYSGQPSHHKLSAAEKEMARLLKVDEKTYLKHRISEQRNSPGKRGRYGQ